MGGWPIGPVPAPGGAATPVFGTTYTAVPLAETMSIVPLPPIVS